MRGIGKIEISVRENRYPARVLEISPLPGTCYSLLLRLFVFRIQVICDVIAGAWG